MVHLTEKNKINGYTMQTLEVAYTVYICLVQVQFVLNQRIQEFFIIINECKGNIPSVIHLDLQFHLIDLKFSN